MLKAFFKSLILVVPFLPSVAFGQQAVLTSGQVWGITQYLPLGPVSEGSEQPSCTLGTRVWDDKGVDIRYVLTGPDYIEPRLAVHSESWQLPVGRKTDITLVTVGGPMKFNLEATRPNVLEGSLDPKVIGEEADFSFRAVLSYLLRTRGEGYGFGVKFAGNEPQWTIPSMESVESFLNRKMFDRCVADLRRKAAAFYPASGGTNSGGQTSPFADGPDTEEPQRPKPREDMTMTDFANRKLVELEDPSWTFEVASNEEYGPDPICTLNAEQKGINVGFEATATGGLSAYVDGFFNSEGKTDWLVDDSQSIPINLVFDGDAERYVSEGFPTSLKDQVFAGTGLDISGGRGDRLMISLRGIKAAASQFNQCLRNDSAKAAPQDSAPSFSENPARDRFQPIDMAYGGIKIRLPEFILNAASNAMMSNGKDVGTAFEFDEGSMRRFQLDGPIKPISALLTMAALNRVTYRVDQPGWAVVSGFPDEAETKIYYGACRKAQAKFVCIDFTYDKRHRDVMDDIVKAASLSLKR